MIAKDTLKEAMKVRGMMGKTLAAKMKMTQASLSRCLTTQRSFNVDTLIRLLDFLGYELIVRDKITGQDFQVLEPVSTDNP